MLNAKSANNQAATVVWYQSTSSKDFQAQTLQCHMHGFPSQAPSRHQTRYRSQFHSHNSRSQSQKNCIVQRHLVQKLPVVRLKCKKACSVQKKLQHVPRHSVPRTYPRCQVPTSTLGAHSAVKVAPKAPCAPAPQATLDLQGSATMLGSPLFLIHKALGDIHRSSSFQLAN